MYQTCQCQFLEKGFFGHMQMAVMLLFDFLRLTFLRDHRDKIAEDLLDWGKSLKSLKGLLNLLNIN